MFIYFSETETERERRRGREREGDTESKAGSGLRGSRLWRLRAPGWAVRTEPNVGLELMNHGIMTWVEVGPVSDWATQVALQRAIFEILPTNPFIDNLLCTWHLKY